MATVNLKGAADQLANVRSFPATVAVVEGDLCFLDSNGKMDKTDADAAGTTNGLLALATQTLAIDAIGQFALRGELSGAALTIGGPVYVSLTLAGVTQTKPSVAGDTVRIVGYATSATAIEFNPSDESALLV